jgi:hypothetical protein
MCRAIGINIYYFDMTASTETSNTGSTGGVCNVRWRRPIASVRACNHPSEICGLRYGCPPRCSIPDACRRQNLEADSFYQNPWCAEHDTTNFSLDASTSTSTPNRSNRDDYLCTQSQIAATTHNAARTFAPLNVPSLLVSQVLPTSIHGD